MESSPVTSRNAIRTLGEEARARAATVPADSAEHDFYSGVIAATQDHLHAESFAVHNERWLMRQTPPFREGYMETSTLIVTAGRNPPNRLVLPAADRFWHREP